MSPQETSLAADSSCTDKFSTADITSLFCVELFSGTAGLTASLRALNLNKSFGVDSQKFSSPKAPIMVLDLTKKKNQALVMQWVRHPLCCYVHLGVPCGTASRAREIRMSKKRHGPRPLRSIRFPDGIPGLKHLDLLRTALANALYDFSTQIIFECEKYHVWWTIENPSNSLFWQTSFWLKVATSISNLSEVRLQNCAYGGSRPKWTTISGSLPGLSQLAKTCPGNHKHAPWGLLKVGTSVRFATSAEAEYPIKLCQSIAKLVEQALLMSGVSPAPEALPDIQHHHLAHARAVAGTLVKASRLPPLVSEFKQTIVAFHDESFQGNPPQWFEHNVPCLTCKQHPSWNFVPGPAKLLKFVADSSNGGKSENATKTTENDKNGFPASDETVTQKSAVEAKKLIPDPTIPNDAGWKLPSNKTKKLGEATWALPWKQEEFVAQAVKAGHPKSLHGNLPTPLLYSLDAHLSLTEEDICSRRIRWAKKWTHEIAHCEAEESCFKAQLPENSRRILKDKKLVIWKRMLEEAGYVGTQVVDDCSKGFQLAGPVEPSGLFEKSFTPAMMTVKELDDSASINRALVVSRTTSSGDSYIDERVWEKTMEEQTKGWLEGPLPVTSCSLPSNVSVSRRFGVHQGIEDDGSRKIRPIDDFSESKINSTVSSSEKVTLHTVDLVGSLLRAWFSRCEAASKPSLLWSRTFDLKSAYRQLPLSEDAFRHAVLSVFCPETKQPSLFQLKCLPFGATASVSHFLRAAYSLWFLGCTSGLLIWTSYFDDFWCMSPPNLSSSAGAIAELIFGLTGWIFAKEGAKHVSFSQVVSVLGISIDLSHSKDGRCLFANTEKRISELKQSLSKCLEEGTLSKAMSLQLRGRLGFCESQIFGRVGNLAMKSLIDHAYRVPFKKTIDGRCKQDILRLLDRLEHQGPRVVNGESSRVWILFTDASFEPGKDQALAGLGAVLYDGLGNPVSQFSKMFSSAQIAQLQSIDRKTPIFELEVLALVLALVLWKETIAGAQVVCYLDNNGARDSAIKGYSHFDPASLFLEVLLSLEESTMICPWFARVPSKSNPSDPPSRGELLANVPIANSTMVDDVMCDLMSRAYGPLP